MDKRPIATFAAKSRDDALRAASTSGGAFTELARVIFSHGGVVAGAGWSHDPFCVRHKLARQESELAEMRGAKYAPSDMTEIYNLLSVELQLGRLVLFTGTPCQVAAVRKRFGEQDNLMSCAIICHSIPMRDVWSAYVNELEYRAGSPIRNISFRDKGADSCWRKSRVIIDFENVAKRIVEPLADNAYARAFFSGYSTNLPCASCGFRGGRHGADLVIGDFWGIEDSIPSFDDGSGVSVVLAYTARGERLLYETQLELMPVTYGQALAKNPHIEKGLTLGGVGRDRFLKSYKRIGVVRAVRYAKEGPWYRRFAAHIYRCIRHGRFL